MGDLINVMLHLDKINIQLLNSFDFNFLYSILFHFHLLLFITKIVPPTQEKICWPKTTQGLIMQTFKLLEHKSIAASTRDKN